MSKHLITFSFIGVFFFIVTLASLVDSGNLAEYTANKKAAVASLDILLIHDQESYIRVKDKIADDLSEDLRQEIFHSDSYTGVNLLEPYLRVIINKRRHESSKVKNLLLQSRSNLIAQH